MAFSFLHSANLIAFVVVLYFHAGSSTTSVSPSPSVSDSVSQSNFSTSWTPSANGTVFQTATTSEYRTSSINESTTSTTISTSSVVSTATPPKQTIVNLTCILLETWNDTLQNSSSGDYEKLKKDVETALKALYNGTKYDLDESSIIVSFTKYGGNPVYVRINAQVRFGKGIAAESVEDDFLGKVKARTLGVTGISTENAEATPIGVEFGEWNADDGECTRACSDSETSTGQPFNLERTCTPGVNSCRGLKKKKKTTDCKTYCDSSVASHLSFSLTGLVMAVLVTVSLQL